MLSYDDRNELTSEWVWRGIMCMCSTSEVWAPMPPASDYGDRDYIHRYGDLHAIIQCTFKYYYDRYAFHYNY